MCNASKLKAQEAKDMETYITAIGKYDPKWFIDLAQIHIKDLQVFAIIKLAAKWKRKDWRKSRAVLKGENRMAELLLRQRAVRLANMFLNQTEPDRPPNIIIIIRKWTYGRFVMAPTVKDAYCSVFKGWWIWIQWVVTHTEKEMTLERLICLLHTYRNTLFNYSR